MALSDFDVVIGAASGSIIGGDDGTQQVNASLGSPLTLQGNDCRNFEGAGSGSSSRDVLHLIKASTDPDFSSIPDTKAISVRAWVRKPTMGGNHNAAFVTAKGNTHDGSSVVAGVTLSYGRWRGNTPTNFAGNYTDLQLTIWNIARTQRLIVPNIVTLAVNTWHQIRLDVIPTLNGGSVDRDTIRVYTNTGTEASPVWTLQHEEIVLLAEVYSTPWGAATTRVGWGVSVSDDATRVPMYIDTFEALLKNR